MDYALADRFITGYEMKKSLDHALKLTDICASRPNNRRRYRRFVIIYQRKWFRVNSFVTGYHNRNLRSRYGISLPKISNT